jgi:hypothetical protein
MTIEWLAGNRLRGTTAERPNFGLPSGSVGGWVELARTTLGSAGDTIDVSSLADKRYLMYLYSGIQTGDVNSWLRLNADSGSNYALRYNSDGASETTSVSQSNGCALNYSADSTNGNQQFAISYLANYSTKEKLVQTWNCQQQTAGAGTAPNRRETVGKHEQTTNPISAINFHTLLTSGKNWLV